MNRALAILLLTLAAGTAQAQNRIASGSTYHTTAAATLPYTFWTNTELEGFWFPNGARDPAQLPTWTAEDFLSRLSDGYQTNASCRPLFVSGTYKFDGIDDWITITNDLNPVSSSASFLFWTKIVGGTDVYHVFFYRGIDDGGKRMTVYRDITTGKIMTDKFGSPQLQGAVLASNVWIHIGIVYDFNGGKRIYTNGVLNVSDTDRYNYTEGENARLGIWIDLAAPLNGYMSDILHTGLMQAADVKAHYDATKDRPRP